MSQFIPDKPLWIKNELLCPPVADGISSILYHYSVWVQEEVSGTFQQFRAPGSKDSIIRSQAVSVSPSSQLLYVDYPLAGKYLPLQITKIVSLT